jgi:hypothetical protein
MNSKARIIATLHYLEQDILLYCSFLVSSTIRITCILVVGIPNVTMYLPSLYSTEKNFCCYNTKNNANTSNNKEQKIQQFLKKNGNSGIFTIKLLLSVSESSIM